MSNDTRILQTKEDADRKADEKASQVGIVFENIKTGEIRVASTVEHIAAFFNSSDEGPNAKNKQDFNWRLSPEDLIELERIKNDPLVMDRIAQGYQIPAEDVADYNVLKYMASNRFREAAQAAQSETKDYESDYERRVREAREGKKKVPVKQEKKAEPKARTVSRDAGDGQFVSKKEADKNPKTTVTEKVNNKSQEKVDKSTEKADNKSNS